MRIKDGTLRTLDQDIVSIWKEHGWEVIKIRCTREEGKPAWVIVAEWKGNSGNEVSQNFKKLSDAGE